MIPKKIHFCWMSGDPYPAKIKRCMKTWRRVMPDYEIKLWNAQNFDVEGAPDYVREAIRQRKWAFAPTTYACTPSTMRVASILTPMCWF